MQERIGFGKRFGAAVIDVIIIYIVGSILGRMLFPSPETIAADILASGGDLASTLEKSMRYAAMAGAVQGIIGCLYGLQDVFMAGTLGKSLLKITIRAEDASPAAQNTLWTRYLIKYAGQLCAILAITGMSLFYTLGGVITLGLAIWTLTSIFGPTAQAAWDKIAKTAVYDKEATAAAV
jgi:hypothetical protein